MPIHFSQPSPALTQAEFGEIAYQVLGQVFAIHNELGRFFEESIYKRALAAIRTDVTLEAPLDITFGDFSKRLFLDVVVGPGAIFECKAAETIHPRHKAQLLQYLMLAEQRHGMLINVRPFTVQHEFVNNALSPDERRRFEVQAEDWNRRTAGAQQFEDAVVGLLNDWGTCLQLSLYEEALVHCLGGEALVRHDGAVLLQGQTIGEQVFRCAAPGVAFKLTALESTEACDRFEDHTHRLLAHTDLSAILWANLGRHRLTFKTIE
jgi:GxxExxY protein